REAPFTDLPARSTTISNPNETQSK
ncbi:hypothetical protein D047_2709B, partial [Vibrio parahaemolyticus VPTS-2010_2]